jgi:DNA-binding NtrC family response regulator
MSEQIGARAGTQGQSVLLVDDNAAQAEMYALRLERAGYRTRVTHGAEAAVEAVRSDRPDLVVLDIAMPGRDGISALQELMTVDPQLPVVIHTAHPQYASDFMTWAADHYVLKSQDITHLRAAIEDSLNGEDSPPSMAGPLAGDTDMIAPADGDIDA